MASRKEQKEQARAARLAKEQELAAKVSRTRRIQIFGGLIAAAVIIVVVAIAVSSGGSKTAAPNSSTDKADVTAVKTLLNNIPQNGTVLGSPTAPVTLTYYGDLQCPICQEFTLEDLPQFIEDQVRTDKVKVYYRSLCTATCQPDNPTGGQSVFNTQQVAAYAAGKQSLFWDYAELFYHEQGAEDSGYVTASWLNGLAKQITGLNYSQWQTDRKDPAYLDQVDADNTAATKAGIDATPSLFMTGKKGTVPVEGTGGAIPDYTNLVAAIQAVS